MRIFVRDASKRPVDVCSGVSQGVYDATQNLRPTSSSREKGWQVFMVSLASMRSRKPSQAVVKLVDRPESNGFGI
jgi:hypothetical protein